MYKTEVIGYTPIAKKLRTSAMNWKKQFVLISAIIPLGAKAILISKKNRKGIY